MNFPVNYSQDAHFAKGDKALMMYFLKYINYSEEAVINNVRGTAVFSFVVIPDSTITDVLPLSNICYGIEDQVAGLIKKLHYAPAMISGSPYRSSVIINVIINSAHKNTLLQEK